jgi:hypothetical protein
MGAGVAHRHGGRAKGGAVHAAAARSELMMNCVDERAEFNRLDSRTGLVVITGTCTLVRALG